MPDHAIMHVQYSNGVIIWQRVLRVVKTLNVHSNNVNKFSYNRKKIVFVLNHEFLLTVM